MMTEQMHVSETDSYLLNLDQFDFVMILKVVFQEKEMLRLQANREQRNLISSLPKGHKTSSARSNLVKVREHVKN